MPLACPDRPLPGRQRIAHPAGERCRCRGRAAWERAGAFLRGDPTLGLDARPAPWCPTCRDYHRAGRCPEAIAEALRELPYATAAAAYLELVA